VVQASNIWVVSVIDRRGEGGNVHGVFDTVDGALEYRRTHSLQLMSWERIIVEGLVLNDPNYDVERSIEDSLY
jgi:hypothetical protein